MTPRALLFFAMLLAGADARAFKPELHRLIALRAAQLHANCYATGLGPIEAADFAQGAVDEDETQFFSRIFNWHFYNRDKSVPSLLFFETTLESILDTRERNVVAADKATLWNKAGRVVHYIQDMSVPAHAVPIWHIGDSFDGYGFTGYGFDGPSVTLDDECPMVLMLVATTSTAKALVDASAKKTWNALHASISDRIRSPWAGNFWCTGADESCRGFFRGFRRYLGPHAQESYGKAMEVPCARNSSELCVVGAPEYKHFFEARFVQAIVFSAAWIEAVRNGLKPSPERRR